MKKSTLITSMFILLWTVSDAYAIPAGAYNIYIKPTPIVSGVPDYGTPGNWNSAFTPSGQKFPMIDNPLLINSNGRGTGVNGLQPNTFGDGWAGNIGILVDGAGNFTVTQYQVDLIPTDAVGEFAQYGPVTAMGGIIDGYGNMIFDPTGRLGAADSTFPSLIDKRWNVDDYDDPNNTQWTTMTTGTIVMGTNPLLPGGDGRNVSSMTGTPLWESPPGSNIWHAVLVEDSHVGSDWGGFYGDPIWAVDIVPVSAVPEPSSLLLAGTGLVGLFGVARKRVKK